MPENNIQQSHLINEILADFNFYIEPNILKPEFHNLFDFNSVHIDGVKKYQEILSNIQYAWQKVMKYKKYFNTFYTAGEIENFEALNHHIHAYLQDMATLKNKIEVLFGALKNDLKKIASNKDDIIVFIEAGINKILEVFKEVSDYRNPHVHDGRRFMDGELLKAENAHRTLEMFSNPIFDAMLNQDYKPELVAKLEKTKQESFEKSKKHWVELATDNNEQVTGFLHAILETVRPVLYQFLNIKPVKETIDLSKKTS
jgi:hypothetical protein